MFVDGCFWCECQKTVLAAQDEPVFLEGQNRREQEERPIGEGKAKEAGWGEIWIRESQLKAQKKGSSKNRTLSRERVGLVVFCGAQHVRVRG